MPMCSNCKYEYIEGAAICPDCGVTLIDETQLQKPEELSEDYWTVVYNTNNEYEVEMIKDNLEGAGITANILSQKDRNFPAPGDFSVIKLLVKKNDIKEALNYIEEINRLDNSENGQAE